MTRLRFSDCANSRVIPVLQSLRARLQRRFINLHNSCVSGHQKKLMLAVKRLAEMQRNSDGRGSPRKKPPPITQQQEGMSVDSPPPDGELPPDDENEMEAEDVRFVRLT